MLMNDTTLPELMTVAEVAELWRQRKETVYRKVRSGELPAVRLGDETSALRIPRREIERIYEMSAAGSGSFVDSSAVGSATGLGSSVDAGGLCRRRPQTPAAHVRDPDPAGSRTWVQRARER